MYAPEEMEVAQNHLRRLLDDHRFTCGGCDIQISAVELLADPKAKLLVIQESDFTQLEQLHQSLGKLLGKE